MSVIIVSGNPGTGKTTVAKQIAKLLDHKYIDVKKLVKKEGLDEDYDNERKCFIIDEKKMAKLLVELIRLSDKDLVLDSHLTHFIPAKKVDLCVITKADLKVLEQRLKKRRYSQKKVSENLECEIFDVCYEEAKEFGHNILLLNTTKEVVDKKLLKLVKDSLKK